MTAANLSLILSVVLLGYGKHDHRLPKAGACLECGVPSATVLREIQILRTSRKEDDREDAAEDLRKLDWRCHPDAVLALCDALTLDPSEDVREEAAESLGKMGACIPAAHEALARAAATDRKGDVRKEARKALSLVGRRCIAECRTCGPIPTGSVIQGPTIIPPDWMPYLAPPAQVTPRAADPAPVQEPQLEPLPPALPGSSSLPDIPPPPPTPVLSSGPFGVRPSATKRVR